MWTFIFAYTLNTIGIKFSQAIADSAITHLLLAMAGFAIFNVSRFLTIQRTNAIYLMLYLVLMIVLVNYLGDYVITNYINDNFNKFFYGFTVPSRYMYTTLMLLLVAVSSGLRHYYAEEKEFERRKNELTLLQRDAELSGLRMQLQPHFLFNSLNSISALAGSKTDDARRMIELLADFLRGSLAQDHMQRVSLKNELQQIGRYLEIEKVRFGNRLAVAYQIDEACHEMNLPSLILQPLLENAIKFGLYGNTGTVTITIIAEEIKQNLVLSIINPIGEEDINTHKGTGFGINAVQRRLALLYHRNDLFEVQKSGGEFVAKITIPQAS